MGWGTGNLGGGSGGFNFKIVGGTSEPSSPRENDIWINTDSKITSWVFSANEPENPESGMIWISTGSSSNVAFNALKKNGIHLYPISAKKYIAGGSASILGEDLLGEMVLGSTINTDSQWVDVTAKSYQGGEWVEWFTGFLGKGINKLGTPTFTVFSTDGGSFSSKSFTQNTDGTFTLSIGASNSWINAGTFFPNKTDLSGYASLTIKYKVNSRTFDGAGHLDFCVNNANDESPIATTQIANSATSINIETTKTIDISSVSEGYVQIYAAFSENDAVNLTITEITPS